MEQKQLPEIFKELQESRNRPPVTKHVKSNIARKQIQIRLIHIIIAFLSIISLIGLAIIFSRDTSFATGTYEAFETQKISETIDESQNTPNQEIAADFEKNNSSINIIEILCENTNTTKRKEIILEERSIAFTTSYKENSLLPKGEEIILQEGKNGLEEVFVIKTFEQYELINEEITRNILISDYVEQIIEIGTSEFLAKYKIHLGDLMYLKEDGIFRENADSSSKSLGTIAKYSDVKLLAFSDDWCRVEFEKKAGYIKSSLLTSPAVNPEVSYENRKKKALAKLSFEMKLNEPTGLILSDYKKILTDDPKDKNKIFINNIEIFYNMEQKYNMNGIFLLAVGIHESAWGSSLIAQNKNNLFGYGAYDSDPYTYALSFTGYGEGITFVAQNLAMKYLNMRGTVVYDEEKASGLYYNEPTLTGVNVRYATDKEWAAKVYKIMEYLYGKL